MSEANEVAKTEITMKELILDFAKDPEGLIFFQMVGDGAFYIANRNHKLARGSIVFPKEICSNNLKSLNDWFIVLTAIPSSRMNEYIVNKIANKKK